MEVCLHRAAGATTRFDRRGTPYRTRRLSNLPPTGRFRLRRTAHWAAASLRCLQEAHTPVRVYKCAIAVGRLSRVAWLRSFRQQFCDGGQARYSDQERLHLPVAHAL